jgi:HYDIN/CFA65/VesB-like, Ig-like domain
MTALLASSKPGPLATPGRKYSTGQDRYLPGTYLSHFCPRDRLPARSFDGYFGTSQTQGVFSLAVLGFCSNSSRFRSLMSAACLVLIFLLAAGCASYRPNQVPGLSISASSFNFQTVVVGQKATQLFQISNTGSAPLQISALPVSNAEFTITGASVPRTILPAGSLSYTLTFAPTSPGSATATVRIVTSAASQAASISLLGNGEKAFANLVIAPTVVNFGNLALKSTSAQNVTLQNTGDINLSLQGVTVSGAGFGYSDLSPGVSLAPNQKVTFQVWFSPKVAGPSAATLSLLSPNISSPETVSMSGEGLASTTSSPAPPPPATQHSVVLTWIASTGQVIGYRVYRSETSGGSYSPLNGTAISAVSYKDSAVSSGTTYYYVVTAVDSAGTESVYSNQVTAVIPST